MSSFCAIYGIEPIDIPEVRDSVLLPHAQYLKLKGLAEYGGMRESDLTQAPQFIRHANGYERFAFLASDDFHVLCCALPDPNRLFRSARHRVRKDYYAWGSILDDGSFLVYRDSEIAEWEAEQFDRKASIERSRLIGTTRVERKRNSYLLKYDEPFATPALAACVIAGYNAGNEFWTNYFDVPMSTTR